MSHFSPAVRLGASLWLGMLAGIAQAQSPTVNPSDGCPPTSAAKKNFGAGLLSALNSGANAIKQAASGLNGSPQQAANTANQVAGATASASSTSNCSGAASSTSTAATSSSATAASPLTAPGTTAAPTRMADASANSAAWTPPGDTPTASAGPPDFAKLPQITGLGIGLSVSEALATIQKLHPGKHVNQVGNGPDVRHSFVETLGVALNSSGYITRVDLTGPPEAQLAWHVGRQLAQPHVARTVVLTALRQKYGHETVAVGLSQTVPETSDDKIMFAWWVYDEQGHLLTSTKLLVGSPYGCAGSIPDMAGSEYSYIGVVRKTNGMAPTGWCAASFVALSVNLGSQPITDSVILNVVDFPLLMRSAQATKAWMQGLQNQAQQQQIQRSNQVQPQL